MATIKDIADKTGVSITTVSRVLSQDKSFNVSEQTRLNILQVAEELNYRAKHKKVKEKVQQSKYRIGLVYWYTASEEINDPYYLSIRMSIEKECKDQSIDVEYVHLAHSDYDILTSLKLDGIIALGKYSQSVINQLYAINENLIVVDCWIRHYNIDVVVSDLETATKDIITYFFDKAIKKVGFICGVENTFDGEEIMDPRLIAYRNEMFARKAFDPNLIELGKFTADSGYEIMSKLIEADELLDAYIVGSDSMAIGCLKALNESNIKVPDEVSIFSYDNTPFSQFTIPSLSTVETNTKLMGESAVSLLVERLKTERTISKKVILPTQLIIRDSV